MDVFVKRREKSGPENKALVTRRVNDNYRLPASSCPGVGCWVAVGVFTLLEPLLSRVNQRENMGARG